MRERACSTTYPLWRARAETEACCIASSVKLQAGSGARINSNCNGTMTSRATKIVAVGHVGGKEQVDSEWHTVKAVFHDFADLPHAFGEHVQSPTLECHGHVWAVMLYPGGNAAASQDDDQVSIYLRCISAMKGRVKVKANFRIRIPSSGTCSSSEKKFVFGGSGAQVE